MSTVPEFSTPRSVIALPSADDAPLLQRYRIENRHHLGPWEPERTTAYYSIEGSRRSIAGATTMARAGLGYPLLAFDLEHTRILASFTLSNVVRGVFQACHLGYGVARDMQGRGLMYEVLQSGLGFAFDHLQLHRVMANYMPRNARSGRLLQRLGFEKEGYARRYMCIAGCWEDHVLTARIRPDDAGRT